MNDKMTDKPMRIGGGISQQQTTETTRYTQEEIAAMAGQKVEGGPLDPLGANNKTTEHPSLLFEHACLLSKDMDIWQADDESQEPLEAYLVRVGWRKVANHAG